MMTEPPTPQPLFLHSQPDPVFVTYHRAAEPEGGAAVLICPPFGWEEICAYRSLGDWSRTLATARHPTLRLTLPGTGDSGGAPNAPDRPGAWRRAITDAAGWLLEESHAERLVCVGMGLGGLLALQAAAAGAPIDDFVLWGVPTRGKALIRQLRAFAQLERAQIYDGAANPPPVPADGEIECGGFVISADTAREIAAFDIRGLDLASGSARRALLLERDGLAVDPELTDRMDALGVDVVLSAGPGYADMTSHPQTSRPPQVVIEGMLHWLRDAPSRPVTVPDHAGRHGPWPVADARTLMPDIAVRETVLSIPGPTGRLEAVLSESDGTARPGCVVLLNAGAVRRVGPNRMWVEAARRWAASGLTVLRADLEGIGDSEGDATPYADDAALYADRFVPQVLSVIDHLKSREVAGPLVVGGLCSGAYWALHAALVDERIDGLLMLNPRVLTWDNEIGAARDMRALLTQRPSLARIRRVARGQRRREFVRWLLGTPARIVRRQRSRDVAIRSRAMAGAIAGLSERGCSLLWLFTEREPLADEFRRDGRLERFGGAAGATLAVVPVRDHTLRPVWAQRTAHQILDDAVAAATGAPLPATGS